MSTNHQGRLARFLERTLGAPATAPHLTRAQRRQAERARRRWAVDRTITPTTGPNRAQRRAHLGRLRADRSRYLQALDARGLRNEGRCTPPAGKRVRT